jgi:hypothetical protein
VGLVPGLSLVRGLGRVRRLWLVLRLVAGGLRGCWGSRLGGPGLLAIDEALKLAAIEEDTAAFTALVDMNATAFVGSHGALALRAGQIRHSSIMWDPRKTSNSTVG